MKLKLSFRTIGKLGFLLVFIGFFMPVACNLNGFEIADAAMRNNAATGLAIYALFASAIAGILIGVGLLIKKKVPVLYDWIVLIVCILSGLIPYLNHRNLTYQTGAHLILAGWIVALVFQLISKSKREK